MDTNKNQDNSCINRVRKTSSNTMKSYNLIPKKKKTIGDYQILWKIGEGSGGKVKLGVDNTGQKYAIKIFNKYLLKKKVRIIKDDKGSIYILFIIVFRSGIQKCID